MEEEGEDRVKGKELRKNFKGEKKIILCSDLVESLGIPEALFTKNLVLFYLNRIIGQEELTTI